MWYREILAYREVTDPKGERTVHQTDSNYERPTFVMDDNYNLSYQSEDLGNGYITQGPGYYTSQNPAEIHHYSNRFPISREVRIPKGARILDYENPTEEDMRSIIDAWNKKYNTNYQYDSSIKSFDDLMYVISNFDESREDFKRRFRVFKNNIPNNTINRLYPLLIEMGFDAIDYIDASGRRGETSNYEEFQETSGMSSRTKDKKNKLLDKKNILIINRAMITMPDLFQKARFRPETLTEEEKNKLKDEQQTTAPEFTKILMESNARIRPRLKEISEALKVGADPQKVLDYIKKIEHHLYKFEDKINFLREIKKYYNENIIFEIFTNQQIEENKQLIRSIIGDYGRGKAVGLAGNYQEAIEKLLKRFEQKYLIDGYANPNLNLEQTILALKEYGKIQKLMEFNAKGYRNVPEINIPLARHFQSLVDQITSFEIIFELVNDMELRANITKEAIMAMINKQEQLRNQTAKVAYKLRMKYVV
jgi:predicted DNA-binding protein YlxM (UPF0122 family)